MANETLSINYYRTDKDMRDLIQSFHELLDKRYKVSGDSLKSLYQQTPPISKQTTTHVDGDKTDVKPLIHHVAEIHRDAEKVPYVEIVFGPEHDEAVKQIKISIEKLFGSDSSSEDLPSVEDNIKVMQQLNGKKSTSAAATTNTKGVVAPHMCTVAWNKSPKRYQECIAIVRTVDDDNQPILHGGAEIKGIFSWSRYDKQYCKVVDNQNGSYNIIYSACSIRYHMLFVTVNGCSVAGGPFLVDIEDDDSWE